METRRLGGIKEDISLLGFGMMRLPLASEEASDIDGDKASEMVARAIDAGVNYFDTAWVYHGGESEMFAGRALSAYPREKYRLATKMPVWQLSSADDMERVFARQLEKCRVDYFDFYLLHNIGGETYDAAIRHGVYEFLRKKKDEGRIKYLGFSMHDGPDLLAEAVRRWEWDFAQIQLNYIDWDALAAKRQYGILTERGIPVVVMEPVRGGVLANMDEKAAGILSASDSGASQASWALRYAASLPGVLTVLSGMTTIEQVEDNIATFKDFRPLSDGERATLAEAAAAFQASGTIPCTGCRYCMDCPAGADIPRVLAIYNHYKTVSASNAAMGEIVFRNNYRTLPEPQKAHKCVACGACVPRCPQGLDIPKYMKEIADFAAAQ